MKAEELLKLLDSSADRYAPEGHRIAADAALRNHAPRIIREQQAEIARLKAQVKAEQAEYLALRDDRDYIIEARDSEIERLKKALESIANGPRLPLRKEMIDDPKVEAYIIESARRKNVARKALGLDEEPLLTMTALWKVVEPGHALKGET